MLAKLRWLWLPAVFGIVLASAACGPTRSGRTASGGTYSVSGLFPDLARVREERKAGPVPESEWNRSGIWQKVEDSPPTYIPKGYPRTSPRTDRDGGWYIDERDGKRLFVPHAKVGDYSPGILQGEASKITQWVFTKKKAWSENSGFQDPGFEEFP